MYMINLLRNRVWKYRGKRIRPYMRNNLKLAGAIIFVPVFLLSMFIFWRDQLLHLDVMKTVKHFEWNVPLIIKSVLCSLLAVAACAVLAYFCFMMRIKSCTTGKKLRG